MIKLSALGDFVLAMPAFARIRAAHPNEPITLLTTPAFEDLAKASPWFDRVWTDGRPRGRRGLAAPDRPGSRGALRAGSTTCRRTTGPICSSRRCALSRPPGREPRPAARSRTAIRSACGCIASSGTPLSSSPPGSGRTRRPRRARPHRPDVSWLVGEPPPRERLALLVPGAAAHRPAKRWPVDHYAEIAVRLIGEGWDVAVIGSEQEKPLAATIRAAGCPGFAT